MEIVNTSPKKQKGSQGGKRNLKDPRKKTAPRKNEITNIFQNIQILKMDDFDIPDRKNSDASSKMFSSSSFGKNNELGDSKSKLKKIQSS